VGQLGVNAHGEVLEPGRVPDCYLGLLLDQPGGDAEVAGVLVVAPRCCTLVFRSRMEWWCMSW
jgi:hypothetical protein